MNISPEKLILEAEATGFRPDVLEKAARLLELLDTIRSHPFLKGKLVLKGGSALNLFLFDVPRLSIDIDLNYTGAQDLDSMTAERPRLEQALRAVFMREEYTILRKPEEHAGGKWMFEGLVPFNDPNGNDLPRRFNAAVAAPIPLGPG